jgi:hypothetical protein
MMQTVQIDPDAALPPGLKLACDFVTRAEEVALIAAIEASGLTAI